MGSNLIDVSAYTTNVVGPDAGNPVTAASVRVMGTALANRTKALQDGKITVASGVTMGVVATGAISCDGTATFSGTGAKKTIVAQEDVEVSDIDSLTARIVVVNESIDLGSTAELTAPTGSNVAVLGRSQSRPRVYVSDVASVTLDTTQADEFVLVNEPIAASPNVVLLRTSTAPLPRENETITLLVTAMSVSTATEVYRIKREDGTVICSVFSIGTHLPLSITVTLRFASGVWRLGPNSGTSYYYDISGVLNTRYGIVPGVGA